LMISRRSKEITLQNLATRLHCIISAVAPATHPLPDAILFR